ncbi:MAG: hypothetical protein ACD_19C00390G0003 [uncultured bacterium]|nr:MAG: hypothetical protein ACD_19C00390G0003 [uncultured bacterium]
MEQAKEMEVKNKFPIIFSGLAEQLANGCIINVNGKKQNLKIFRINLSSLTIVNLVIFLFIIFYFIVIVYFLPWDLKPKV